MIKNSIICLFIPRAELVQSGFVIDCIYPIVAIEAQSVMTDYRFEDNIQSLFVRNQS